MNTKTWVEIKLKDWSKWAGKLSSSSLTSEFPSWDNAVDVVTQWKQDRFCVVTITSSLSANNIRIEDGEYDKTTILYNISMDEVECIEIRCNHD